MCFEYFCITFLNGEITHFATVGMHVVKLFAVTSFIVEYILVVWSPECPSASASTFVKSRFGHYIGLMRRLVVGLFDQLFK